MDFNDLKGLIKVPKLSSNNDYWLVRAEAGKYFQEFYLEDYIAIGWNEMNNLDLICENEDELKEQIEELYPNENRPGLIKSQIYTFVSEMKKGDIVLVPSKSNNQHIAFGEIVEDDIYIEEVEEYDFEKYMEEFGEQPPCPFKKRREVKWLKTVKKEKLDPYLYKLLYSHCTITNANDYSHFIDRTIYSFFEKDGVLHSVFEVKETNSINAFDLNSFIGSMLDSLDIINDSIDHKLDKRSIDIKLNVQSPGLIEFFGKPEVIMGMTFLGVLVIGGEIELDVKIMNGKLNTEGLIEKVRKFINSLKENERQTIKLKKRLKREKESLKIKDPEIKLEFKESDQQKEN
ncbi:hypothetical protein MWH25_08230 [Natroniella acetigena]|uniref:hypothetical protein n=1 Tax=Natroniella acetigena TaxID=52004 RepID=UPI00200B007C|nr:hypothetical protein [Natroniella acetigena]MCK8827730.1 hypothetical protein [Natroniella acetigena]